MSQKEKWDTQLEVSQRHEPPSVVSPEREFHPSFVRRNSSEECGRWWMRPRKRTGEPRDLSEPVRSKRLVRELPS